MSEQALVPEQGSSSQESNNEAELVRFVAIGYTKDGRVDMISSDGDDSKIDIKDLLVFQRFMDDTINKLIDPVSHQTMDAIRQIYEINMRLLAKVDLLESQINNLKK